MGPVKGRVGAAPVRLLLIYDGYLPAEALAEKLAAVRQAGLGAVSAVQLPDPGWTGHRLLALALGVRQVTRQHGLRLLVEDRADVALAAAADGVFLGRGALPPAAVRRILARLPRREFLMGRPASTVEEAALARLEEVDYLLFCPVWPEPGLQALRAVVASVPGLVIAGGGVTPERLEALVEAGVGGVALPLTTLGPADLAAVAAAIVPP